jgi:hypothetical protein
LTDLFGWVATQLTRLNNQYSTVEEFQAFSSAIVIFCKVIKQKPELFEKLDNYYHQVIDQHTKSQLQFSFEQGSARKQSGMFAPVHGYLEFDYCQHPIIRLLTRALFGFMKCDFFYARRGITNIMDAFSSLYSAVPAFRMHIIDQLNEQKNESGFALEEWFQSCYL